MATITIDNTSTTQVVREFLYRIDLDETNNKISTNDAIAVFIGKPQQTVKDFRDLHVYLETAEAQNDIKSITDTKAKIETAAFSTANSDVQVTINLSGNNFLTEGAGQVTSVINQYKYMGYFSEDRSPSNLDVNTTGTDTIKINYNPSYINSIGNPQGNMLWSSTTTNDKGYYHDDQLLKRDYTLSEIMTGNMTLTTNDTITGTITSYKTNQTETGSTGQTTRAITLSSKLGITVNEKQDYSGVIDALSFAKNTKAISANDYSGGVSYKETIANTQLVGTLTQFIANQATTIDLAAALLNQNDKITAKGAYTFINGYLGNDAITLGSGIDTVEFSTTLGANNIDSIKGFKSGTDHISLSNTIFTGYSGSSNLAFGTAATDTNDRIIYDNKTGKLYYDADGTGSTAAIQFATLVGKPAITAADIYTF